MDGIQVFAWFLAGGSISVILAVAGVSFATLSIVSSRRRARH